MVLLTGTIAELPTGAALVSGVARSIELEGVGAPQFARTVAKVADGTHTLFDVVSAVSAWPATTVDGWLRQLMETQLFIEVPNGAAKKPGSLALSVLGLTPQASAHLETVTVGIVGIDPLTIAVAEELALYGTGHVILGTTQDDAQTDTHQLLQSSSQCTVEALEDERAVASLATRCGLLVGSLHAGLLGVAHWANRSALAAGIPAIYGATRGNAGFAGPLIFPGEGACLLCYRMRTMACADDFIHAMALEEEHARNRTANSLVMPAAVRAVASVMAIETIKTLTSWMPPILVSSVLELDAVQHTQRKHRVLQRADCPACRKKDLPPRQPPADSGGTTNLADLADLATSFTSPHCGIIRVVEGVPADVSEPAFPQVIRAEVANNRFRSPQDQPFQPASGKGMDERAALRSTLGEACERYGATCWTNRSTREACYADIAHALIPTDLVLFAEDQYAKLPYTQWDPTSALAWFDGFDLATNTTIAVPAVAAFLGFEGSTADHLFASTSNGLAAGRTLNDAIIGAALEVIERDAFMMAWCHQLTGTRIDPLTIDDTTIQQLTEAYRRRGVSLELYRLPTDVTAVSIYIAIGVQLHDRAVGPGPTAVVGLGCDLTDSIAARKAVLEVAQIRPALKARLRDPQTQQRQTELIDDPTHVAHLEDHDLLFAHPDALKWLAFWRDQPVRAWQNTASQTHDRLPALLASLAFAGHRLVVCDLTPPEFVEFSMHVTRAIIPGFQPIHFGHDEIRLGGQRLFELPTNLGLRPTGLTRADLNPIPHPVS
jgi:ribosomal protein S12 methylthiotransferase accessory factor